ncbi:redoxin domain-containing protein [Sphingobacterium sp. UT-1RO-CII-1]|uniref:redoxin domain-containing protein n=1 Tax=Sphingobacterium sp. UT-1RO-CII-1 TaxID=2995225 RepID=UPI00227D3896|nr:redoxin domain-containing protein [Sphingobacterium sp. UT-1RO-CII-1]MCY4779866.1 redoxin domain-containing protein [Sphingobacterium sp. UT-1RO-CII-1]
MKKIIIYSLYFVITALVVSLLYFTMAKQRKKEQLLVEIATMPDITFRDMRQQKDIHIRTYIGDSALCLVQIDPDCFFCQEQVKDMLDKQHLFNDMAVLFVSPAPEEKLRAYAEQIELHKYPHFQLLYDADLLFPQTFDTATTPTTIVYNVKGNMVVKHEGLIKTEKIIEELTNE